MSDSTAERVRFAPSPTGHLHVGGARTALFNYLIARRTGGTFIVRIEDTDTARNVEGADHKMLADLRWLGLQWDEGAEVGGDYEPYHQSQRRDHYAAAAQQLFDAGLAYYAFDTTEELEALREKAKEEKRNFRYPRPSRFPDAEEVAKARDAGRPVVIRFKAPPDDTTVEDEVMGSITISGDELDDFILVKADGMPTYHLANVVDDAAMKITLVLRGQEFLAQTPRHIALQRALGYSTPRYAHLPLIMDMQGRKLSKRDGDVEVFAFRQAGYLPEVMVNFLALLGWNPGTDQEAFTLDELVEAFGLKRVNRANAKFDREKLLSFNTTAASAADPQLLLATFEDYRQLNDTPMCKADLDQTTLSKLLEVNRGFRTFADIETKSGILFAPDDAIAYDEKAVSKVLAKNDGEGYTMLASLLTTLETAEPWTAESLESLLKQTCESQSIGMGKVAQPIRVAVAGTTVSPAIGDTLALLGRERTLNRIHRCLTQRSV